MLIAVHATVAGHSIVTTTVIVAEVTIVAAEVLVTVWLVIVTRLQLRPSAIEPKLPLPAKMLVVVIIVFHPSHPLDRASA